MEGTSMNERVCAMEKTLREFIPLLKNCLLLSPNGSPDILNIQECSKLTGISTSSLYKKTALRSIPFFKTGKRVLFKREEILNWLTRDYRKTLDEIESEVNKH